MADPPPRSRTRSEPIAGDDPAAPGKLHPVRRSPGTPALLMLLAAVAVVVLILVL